MPNPSSDVPLTPPVTGSPAEPVDSPTESLRSTDGREATHVRVPERIAYGVGDIGGNLIFAPISSFLLFYLTDTVGIGAAIAGTLLLLGRVLDGTMDLVIGSLIDKTRTRWGKARPWILFSIPVVVVAFVLLFNVPAGLDETGKHVYVFVFYFLCLGVGYVGSNLAYHTLLSVISPSSRDRIALTAIRTMFALVTTLVVASITVPLLTAFGGGQGAWSTIALIYGGISVVTFLITFLGTRERVRPTEREDGTKQPFRVMARVVLRNPYFYLAFGVFLVAYATSALAGGVGVYYAKDVLGDANLVGLFAVVQLAPLVIGLILAPRMVGRFGKRLPFLVGLVITIVGFAVTFVDPTSVGLVLGGGLLRSIGAIPQAAALFAMVADVVDYGEWRTGIRVDGMTYAAATAGQNFGAGLGAAATGWILAAGGYVGTAAAQTASARSAEVFLYLGLPLILTVVMVVLVYFLNIDRHMTVMRAELARRRAVAA